MPAPQVLVAGISTEELQKLFAKGPEKGIPSLLEKVMTTRPGELEDLMRTLDLGQFKGGILSESAGATGEGLFAANLETLRALPGLGSSLESWCRTRRQRLEKAWKAAEPGHSRQVLSEVQDLVHGILFFHRYDVLSNYEKGEDTLLPDDATGNQLYEAAALLFGPKPEKGLLSEPVSADAPLRLECCLQAAVIACIAQCILEGGKVFLESVPDRRKHNLLERQYLIAERIEYVSGVRLTRGELGAMEPLWDAALVPVSEKFRVHLTRERCVAYFKFLGLRHNTGVGGRLPPEHIRSCRRCGVNHRWVGVRCKSCSYLLCKDCVPRIADGVCLTCNPNPTASSSAAASSGDGGPGLSPTTAAEARLPNSEEETISSYKEALRKIFKGKVGTVEHGAGVVVCCGRELRLQKFSLLDGTLGFVECPACHKGYYTK
ncbi:MAG: hypothetical protein HYZ53_00735 [Planctomycetes bacterium]|nr:hypothetical protein [Planctomycetota bacterium]